MIRHRLFETRWGFCGVVAGDRGVLATFLPHRRRDRVVALIHRQFPESRNDPALLPGLVRTFRTYFEGRPARFAVRLDLGAVTEFRRRVLEACRRFLVAGQPPTPIWPGPPAARTRPELRGRPWPTTQCRSSYPATGWFDPTARWAGSPLPRASA